jgi:hypothetical protein
VSRLIVNSQIGDPFRLSSPRFQALCYLGRLRGQSHLLRRAHVRFDGPWQSLGGERQDMGATIIGIRHARDQARRLQSVEQTNECNRPDVENMSERGD